MAKKKRSFDAVAENQVQRDVSSAEQAQDRFARAQAALAGDAVRDSILALDAVLPRESSTRPLNPEHVAALAESIGALGLIEPIVVDTRQRLLAGGHRIEAIGHLRDHDPELYEQWFADGVPVRVMDFDAEVDPTLALQIEIAENEHRRDYTASEARALAMRLRENGYSDTVGRPKKGDKALGPAMRIIIGKSSKTIRRMLEGEEGRSVAAAPSVEALARALVKHRGAVPKRLQPTLETLLQGLRDAKGTR